MTGLAILIPAALLLGALGLAGFLWAVRSGQFDDLEGAAMRILKDDDGNSGRDGPAGDTVESERKAADKESQRRDEPRDGYP